MMIPPLSASRRAPPRTRGFTLMNVLIAAFIFGLGMLGIARAFVGVTSAASQNENVSAIASLSNSFWSVVQANSALIAAFASNGMNVPVSYTSSTYTTAPAALQPWLQQVVTTIPGSTATITAMKDSATGADCDIVGGCTIKLSIVWTQAGNGTSYTARTQTFLYRIAQ